MEITNKDELEWAKRFLKFS